MIRNLKIKNIGPAPEMTLEFGKRLNLLTGDNGLGKSFLLDIAWWALTRKWPAEVNVKLTSGKKALPSGEGKAAISFTFVGKAKEESYESTFDRRNRHGPGERDGPATRDWFCMPKSMAVLLCGIQLGIIGEKREPSMCKTGRPRMCSAPRRCGMTLSAKTANPCAMD